MTEDTEGPNGQLLANALSRAEKAERDLWDEIQHSAKMRERAEAAETHSAALARALEEAREQAFRAEHRELVSAACWHRAAEAAKNGKWDSLLLRLQEMTAEERHAKVVLSMDKQREARRARSLLAPKEDTANG